ncbi:serine/threonine protein kinase [Affinibrenneria salicis]|uniref:Stress response kinase A n=2 Tax=Affinibrenneria salicis TaxID=2590031 RepID=A0A5J5FV68_9GAMM|nr:serine/threonine protein kinase [Affinibrenneria salicis]KAA8997425.1 serine/threonine protein kinase [Affinibrenneria salicis]
MNSSAFNFQTLFPELIMDAVQETGLIVDSGLTALNSYENRVYQFSDEDRNRYVVKFYRPERWSAAQIEEEHTFAFDLVADDIPVVAPLRLREKSLHVYQDFCFAVYPSVGARAYEMDNEEQMEWTGRYLGRFHQTAVKRQFIVRPTIGLPEYLLEPREVLAATSLIPQRLREGFMLSVDALIQAVQAVWRSDWRTLRLHGDCHPGNILWRDGPVFVDLDDARHGPAVQDLWMLLHGERQDQRIQLDILLEAYNEFGSFDMRELDLIEPLRAMRMLYYLAWVVRRWQDPAFPRSFPWMTDEDFWSRQISIFTEQVRLLQDPPLQLAPMY